MKTRPLAAAAMLCGAACAVQAATNSQTLSFASATQSIWGSGGSSSFGASGYIVGNHSIGVSFATSASTGTVNSSVGGTLSSTYDDLVGWNDRHAVQVGFDFFGNSLAGSLVGALGARISVDGHLNETIAGLSVGWNPSIYDANYSLDINKTFTPAILQTVNGSDAFTPASVGVSIPSFGIGLGGGASVDLDVQQTAALQLTGLSGLVEARNRDTGETVTQVLSLTSPSTQNLSFDLASSGTWDFSVLDLSLANHYATSFALNILGDIEYFVGIYCGDPGNPDDNFGCIAEDKKRQQLTGINLFSSPQIALDYGQLDRADAFSIEVSAVPEPSEAALMLAGLGLLIGLHSTARRRQSL
jgi:hypothetical protein